MNNTFLYKTTLIDILIEENGSEITRISFGDKKNIEMKNIEMKRHNETPLIKEAVKQLNEYITGKRKEFDLPLAIEGTAFQKKVWASLLQIPYGETRTYKDIAKLIGNEKASRAVGMANNKNKIAIIIPCHRVIGANSKLVGYAGGIDLKEKLLGLENKYNYHMEV